MSRSAEHGDGTEVELPESLGPYRVEGLIGSGGMGVVYRARSPQGREVAVKTLLPHMAEAYQRERFAREGSIRIDHPNVIEVIDAGTAENGSPFIVLELLRGRSLEERLRDEVIGADEIIRVLRQACEGLAAVHASDIVHRDLKPANIFCCDDGAVKLLDFGIAQISEGPKLTAEGTVLGSVSYLSPEQARGSRDIDPTTDVWAMGVVMYEALTGAPPFDRDTPLTTILQIIQGSYVRLAERAPHIPASICEIVDRCLQRTPTARYRDGAALARAMERLEELDTAQISVPTGETEYFRVSLPPGEERVVVVLLARHARDPDAIEAAIVELGGEAIPFLGEGVIGLFGGTSWEGDEVERALEAALRCRGYADSVAVGSGRARSTGSDVSGAAVMAAERGCRANVGGVVVDADAARTLTGKVDLVSHPGGLFEVVESTRRSSVVAPPTGEVAIFGRDLEIAQLRAAVQSWQDRAEPQVIEILGPLGIGKSKLRAALAEMLGDEIAVLSARGEPIRAEVGLHLWASMLARRLKRTGPDARDDAAQAEAIYRMTLDTIQDPNTAEVQAAFLRELLRIPGDEPAPLAEARSDPQLMGDRLRLAILDFVLGLARRGPVAILLEDLQWADTASIELLERLGEEIGGRPVLLLLTSRTPVVDTEMGALADYPVERIELSGLPPLPARQLATNAAGVPLPDDVIDEIVRRSEGNPFFLEQMALALGERSEEDDSPDPGELPLPATVEAAVQSRLDRLPSEVRELVKRVSVLKRPFLPEEAEALGAGDVTGALDLLVRREIFQRVDDELAFRSPLMADVTYDLLTPELRTELHALAASYLEHARGVDPEEAAEHHERAGARFAAAACYARSALAAARRGISDKVLRCTDRAFELGVSEDQLHDLHMARVEALRFLGRRAEQEEDLNAAFEHAKDDRERARARTEQISLLSWQGRKEEAEQVAEEAVALARASGDPEVLVRALCLQAQMLILAGRHSEAEAPLREAARAARNERPHLRAEVFELRALWAHTQGDHGRSLQDWQKALDELRASGSERRAAAAQQNLADCYSGLGAYEEAESALREALEHCRRVGHKVHEAYALANLGRALTGRGKTDAALETLDEAEALLETMRDDRLRLYLAVYRARALLEGGRPERAVRVATAASDSAHERGRRPVEVMALSTASLGYLALGDVASALEASERAMQLRDELGSVEEGEGDVFSARVRALEAAGRGEEAEGVRARARERLTAIANKIRDATWRERFLNDIRSHRELMGR